MVCYKTQEVSGAGELWVFKQKGVIFVLPIICTCPSHILLAMCRVYTDCQYIYVRVIAYYVMSSVNTEPMPASVCRGYVRLPVTCVGPHVPFQ